MANTQITFANGLNTVTCSVPQFGYSTEINLRSLKIQKTSDNQYKAWDNYTDGFMDSRTTSFDFILPRSSMADLASFFNDSAKGRCETVTLSLGVTPTGFFPFGPDYGDVGDFTVRMAEYPDFSGMLVDPWKYFQAKFSMVCISNPAYSIPSRSGYAEGQFQIGTISGLLYPQNGFAPKTDRNYLIVPSQAGVPYYLDSGVLGDVWTTTIDQQANHRNTAGLINYLIGPTVRGQSFTMIAGTDYNLFGVEKPSSGTFTSKMINQIITVTHDRFDRFTTSFECVMQSVV